jgi:hypothetical protein
MKSLGRRGDVTSAGKARITGQSAAYRRAKALLFLAHDPEMPVLDLVGDGNRFSDKTMRAEKYLCLRSGG